MEMKYEELLKEKEWEVKRYEILARDNYTCQDCGCRGINNDIFFPISSISDLDILLPDCLFNGEDLSSFCSHIQWKGQCKHSFSLTNRCLKEHFYIAEMIAIKGSIWGCSTFQFRFVTNTLFSKLKFQRNDYDICLQYKGRIIKDGHLTALMFTEDMEQMSYAAINYSCNKSGEDLKLNILLGNKYFHFHFRNYEGTLFEFTPLNIHHNYYILGKAPWDYDNNALVTLCSRCHQKRHKQTKIPLYRQDRLLIYPALPVCDRCNGTGYLPQYHYYMGGICFKCHGEGVYGYDESRFHPNI